VGLPYLQFLGPRGAATVAGSALAAAMVWALAPFVAVGSDHPLEPAFPRLALAVLAGALPLLLLWRSARRRRTRDEALARAIAEDPAHPAGIGDKLQAALHRLAVAGKLAVLPWYVVIGPPGAGKTTAIAQAGLAPLDGAAPGPIDGVGGTRNCDWWLTKDAVLLDTAGRFTMQDGDSASDAAEWRDLLGLLRRRRGRQALNGAIVAVSATDLLAQSEEERRRVGTRVRARLAELHDTLAADLPVYVLVTKLDRLAGFTAFFDDLDAAGRRQGWGATLPLVPPDRRATLAATLATAFDDAMAALNARLIERLQAENDPDRRGLILDFPAQVEALGDPLRAFLYDAFATGIGAWRPHLRGFYLTSAIQTGAPLDRLRRAMARGFGLDLPPLPVEERRDRSYFLQAVVTDTILREAWLAAGPAQAWRRWAARATLATIALATVAGLAVGALAYVENGALLGRVDRVVADFRAAVDVLVAERAADADPRAALPALDALSHLSRTWQASSVPGLDPTDKLRAGLDIGYRHALETLLLPRLLGRIEDRMAAGADRPDRLYQALRTYLMLGGQGPFAAGEISSWLVADARSLLPLPDDAGRRAALEGHIGALLREPPPPLPLHGPLVERVRAILNSVPLPERAYAVARSVAAGMGVPDWRVEALAGPADLWFASASDAPDYGRVPGIYTYDGFRRGLLPVLYDLSASIAADLWVLDPTARPEAPKETQAALVRAVLDLYLDDYAMAWDDMLRDLALATPDSDDEAEAMAAALAAPNSPLLVVLVSAIIETALDRPAEDAVAREAEGKIEDLLGGERPWRRVDGRFARLRDALAGDDVLAPPSGTLALLNRLETLGRFDRPLPAIPTTDHPMSACLAPAALPDGGDADAAAAMDE
jgi:type VI secretion system protein ImpL